MNRVGDTHCQDPTRQKKKKTNMSWQEFVDKHLMVEMSDGKKLSCAAIAGFDGLVWAKSKSFPEVTKDELEKIMKGFEDNKEMGEYGIHIGGVKYIFIQSDAGEVIRGKKGTGGITIRKTQKSLIIGMYEEPVAASQGSMVVEKLGDYLHDHGF